MQSFPLVFFIFRPDLFPRRFFCFLFSCVAPESFSHKAGCSRKTPSSQWVFLLFIPLVCFFCVENFFFPGGPFLSSFPSVSVLLPNTTCAALSLPRRFVTRTFHAFSFDFNLSFLLRRSRETAPSAALPRLEVFASFFLKSLFPDVLLRRPKKPPFLPLVGLISSRRGTLTGSINSFFFFELLSLS